MAHDAGGPSGVTEMDSESEQSMSLQSEQVGGLQENMDEEVEENDMDDSDMDEPLTKRAQNFSQAVETDSED
jgi:hypothetical protein